MATITGVSTTPSFQASGIASGIDSAAIIDKLMEANAIPLKQIEQRQADYQIQITTLGTMISQLKDLQTQADALAKGGTVAIVPNSTYTDFKVTGSAKSESSFDIAVESLAKEAKYRSAKFTSAQDDTVVPDGKLQFNVDGTDSIEIDTAGKTLADVAEAINLNISELSASVVSTGDGYYLNVSRKTTGYTTTPESALSVVQDPGLGLAEIQAAQNAKIWLDGLPIERSSNTISNVISGVTLNLNKASNTAERVVFVADSAETGTKLQTFIDAYNTMSETLRSQLVTDPNQRYGESLVNGTTATAIQRSMQRMLSTIVIPSGGVRTLADLGMEIQRDGSISLNAITLASAIEKNPEAVNSIFSDSTNGIAKVVEDMVKAQTAFNTGILTGRQRSLQGNISEMDEKALSIQNRLDLERKRLVSQFTAMEQLMSSLNGVTTYLNNVANLKLSK